MKTRVSIVKNWDDFWITDKAFLSQIPTPLKDRFEFKIGYECGADFLIVLNRPKKDIQVDLPADRIWGLVQEPPNEIFYPAHRGQAAMGRVYNQAFGPERGSRFRLEPPYIPWFIDKSWDELDAMERSEEKVRSLSCITSQTFFYRGHLARKRFLEALKSSGIELDLFGRGIRRLDDKYEGLRQYRYALVLENYSCPYYVSEKIIDALLSYCVPIYYGCQNLTHYLPQEAVIQIESLDGEAIEKIRSIVTGKDYDSHLKALVEARRKILNEFNFFSFVAREIDAFNEEGPPPTKSSASVKLRSFPLSHVQALFRSYLRKAEIAVFKR